MLFIAGLNLHGLSFCHGPESSHKALGPTLPSLPPSNDAEGLQVPRGAGQLPLAWCPCPSASPHSCPPPGPTQTTHIGMKLPPHTRVYTEGLMCLFSFNRLHSSSLPGWLTFLRYEANVVNLRSSCSFISNQGNSTSQDIERNAS